MRERFGGVRGRPPPSNKSKERTNDKNDIGAKNMITSYSQTCYVKIQELEARLIHSKPKHTT
ncbi:MAG: hypothetical protein N3A69_10865 [Leptospiraceae bacterium]|nr:hypothetical protein [Leptospiraceae bacterium]